MIRLSRPQAHIGVLEVKVYGIQGLRVVDASVFPVIPDTHPVAATYMVAEKTADMIKVQTCA